MQPYLHILWDFEYISQDLIALFLHWLAVFASPDFVLSKCLCFFDILLKFFLIQYSFLLCQFFHPDLYHISSKHASAKISKIDVIFKIIHPKYYKHLIDAKGIGVA